MGKMSVCSDIFTVCCLGERLAYDMVCVCINYLLGLVFAVRIDACLNYIKNVNIKLGRITGDSSR